jgi:hypothetical protein
MSDVATTDTRPFFMDIWREHRFRVDLVARGAEVPQNTIFAMLRWSAVKSEDAEKVLAELGRLYKRNYTLFTVRVRLIGEGDTHATTIS